MAFTQLRSSYFRNRGNRTEFFSDNFDDNSTDTTKWVVTSGLVTVTETSQTLQISPAVSQPGGNYGKYASLKNWDMSSSYVMAKATQVTSGAQTEMQLISQVNENNKFVIFHTNGSMVFRYSVAGVNSDTSLAYSAVDHLWWRLRESAGTLYWDTSPDGTTWVNRRSVANPWLVTNMTIELQAGTYGSEATPGTAVFDYFNVIPSLAIALTGTAVSSITETDIVTGGKTIILTLTGDTWVAAGATFDGQRQNIINGIDSGQAEATGWDAVVKALQGVAGVVRTSSTVVTITLDAQATYNITAQETITATVPATALIGAIAGVATPTFTVAIAGGAGVSDALWPKMTAMDKSSFWSPVP